MQEALIELARQPRVPASPVAWLYRVVRNRAISQFRSARRRERREQLAELRLRQRRELGRARLLPSPGRPPTNSPRRLKSLDPTNCAKRSSPAPGAD